MKYKITNLRNDEWISYVFLEMEKSLRRNDGTDIKLIDTESVKCETKGIDIQSILMFVQQQAETFGPEILKAAEKNVLPVIQSIVAAGIFELIKYQIQKYRRLKEYSPEKKIQIEITDDQNQTITFTMTVEEIMDR